VGKPRPRETPRANGETMLTRSPFSRTPRTLVAFGFLGLWGMALPAGAQITGERALLNKFNAGVAAKAQVADRQTRRRNIDGSRALLNRLGADETQLAQRADVGSSTPAGAEPVDGHRALLGRPETSATLTSRAPSR
jgi:hypothetical protein